MSTEITLPQIQESLGIKITGDFIADVLKIEPSRTDKRAKFYEASQFDEIKAELIKHIKGTELGEPPEKKPSKSKAQQPVKTNAEDDDDL